jgi:SP family general alpha glucoside:H+ symporter-like MFS transporter
MASEKIVPTDHELSGFDLELHDVVELIHRARESDAADRELTIRQALGKYKRAVFWAMFLSTSLIMEGYDLVIVSAQLSWHLTATLPRPSMCFSLDAGT